MQKMQNASVYDKCKMFQHSEEENADEEFDFRPAVGEEDHGEQFISRWLWNFIYVVKGKDVDYCFCAHQYPNFERDVVTQNV